MPNVNTKSVRVMNADEMYVPDELFESLIRRRKGGLALDESSGIILAQKSAYKWLEDKMPHLAFLNEVQLARTLKAFFLKYGNHHVCPKCENLLLRHHGARKCSHCGQDVIETKSIVDFLNDQDYK